MSTLKSSSTDLTLNADGVGNDIIFQSNAGQVGSLTAEGVLTATSFAGSAAALTGLAGEVTGTAGSNTIADNIVDEANLKVSNSPTNGYVLTAQSGNTGGLTWAADSTTDSTKLPLGGGTLTGNLTMGANEILLSDNGQLQLGTSQDLLIYHDGSNSYIKEQGTGNLDITSNGGNISIMGKAGENSIIATADGSVEVYHDNTKKFESSANGVTVTGAAIGTLTTDNDGSFALSASNHFKCTPSGNFTLTFTSIVSQSGNILLVNSGGHTVSAHANTKVDAKFLSTISTAGTYLLAYFSDGTNVYMTNSAIYT